MNLTLPENSFLISTLVSLYCLKVQRWLFFQTSQYIMCFNITALSVQNMIWITYRVVKNLMLLIIDFLKRLNIHLPHFALNSISAINIILDNIAVLASEQTSVSIKTLLVKDFILFLF